MKKLLIAFGIGFAISVTAQQAVTIGVPSGTMFYFDLAACPVGWTEFTAARGLYITGLVNAGTKATAVGTLLTDQENRTHTHTFPHTHTMAHTHSVAATTDAVFGGIPAESDSASVSVSDDHFHTFSVTSSGSSAANTGSESTPNTGTQSVTIAPYMQYLLCSRN